MRPCVRARVRELRVRVRVRVVRLRRRLRVRLRLRLRLNPNVTLLPTLPLTCARRPSSCSYRPKVQGVLKDTRGMIFCFFQRLLPQLLDILALVRDIDARRPQRVLICHIPRGRAAARSSGAGSEQPRCLYDGPTVAWC